ncbi:MULTISPECIES: helicase associated domain-containing protein [Streptomyces]|uniref:helicase associated domain-containing protein n=1 Tax=Streptomyces TaxID=1883 RepID=UPI001EFE2A00|nr:helicase associated domain-containing protein [Streptomyces sp. CBG31]
MLRGEAALSLQGLAPKSAERRRGLGAARRYHRAHHHLDVPQTYQDPADYPLGRRLTWQRHRHPRPSTHPGSGMPRHHLGPPPAILRPRPRPRHCLRRPPRPPRRPR